MGGWRKLHNKELHNLYYSPGIIRMTKSRRMVLAGHVARMGDKRNAHRILVRKPEVKGPQGKPRRRSVDNIKMSLREIDLHFRDSKIRMLLSRLRGTPQTGHIISKIMHLLQLPGSQTITG
jgi:hypothetical protein